MAVYISYKRIFYKMFICTKSYPDRTMLDKRLEICGIMCYNVNEEILSREPQLCLRDCCDRKNRRTLW